MPGMMIEHCSRTAHRIGDIANSLRDDMRRIAADRCTTEQVEHLKHELNRAAGMLQLLLQTELPKIAEGQRNAMEE